MAIETLKKRKEFLAVRGGRRASVPSFLMEAKRRTPLKGPSENPRFGFTVTKKLGGAVVRNRIRRRLKAAISALASEGAKGGYDYVVVARQAALDRAFDELLLDVRRAFSAVHKESPQKNRNIS